MNQIVEATTCKACNKKCAQLACGHYYHKKCCNKNQCPTCENAASMSLKQECTVFVNATQRVTTASNGNVFITVNQTDEWGRTTIIREIKKTKVEEFQQTIQQNPTGQIKGQTNIGIVFLTSLTTNKTMQLNGAVPSSTAIVLK